MSVCIKDVEPPLLAEQAIQIALDYLDRSGEIDDYAQACDFLIAKVAFMIRQGERNKLLLANRAISAFQQHRISRTTEISRAANRDTSASGRRS